MTQSRPASPLRGDRGFSGFSSYPPDRWVGASHLPVGSMRMEGFETTEAGPAGIASGLPVDWDAIRALLSVFGLSLDDLGGVGAPTEAVALLKGDQGLALVGISHATGSGAVGAAVAEYIAFAAFDSGLANPAPELDGVVAGLAVAQLLANLTGLVMRRESGAAVAPNGFARRDRQRYQEWRRRQLSTGVES